MLPTFYVFQLRKSATLLVTLKARYKNSITDHLKIASVLYVKNSYYTMVGIYIFY